MLRQLEETKEKLREKEWLWKELTEDYIDVDVKFKALKKKYKVLKDSSSQLTA